MASGSQSMKGQGRLPFKKTAAQKRRANIQRRKASSSF
jgi:hypothetical protein